MGSKKNAKNKGTKKGDTSKGYCEHNYGDMRWDPEIVKVPYGHRTIRAGSDVWDVPVGYENLEIERWSRTCRKCGHTEYYYRIP